MGLKIRFRPLAGIMVLIISMAMETFKAYIAFPSPCGDYGSYQLAAKCQRAINRYSFRPLAGIMVLIKTAIFRIS